MSSYNLRQRKYSSKKGLCFITYLSQKTSFLKTEVIPKHITKTFHKKHILCFTEEVFF